MKHNQYAEMKFKNGASMYVNTNYITAYAYLKEKDETVVAILDERCPVYFPSDQTKEIRNSINLALNGLKLHAHWMPISADCRGYTDEWECTACKQHIALHVCDTECDFEYCPWCGAKMDEETERSKL